MTATLRYFIAASTDRDLLDPRSDIAGYSTASQAAIVTGSSSVNIVWAAPGVDLDVRNLFSGEDLVFFNRNWADYAKDLTSISGAISFAYTDSGTGLTERVTVLNGATTVGRDKLVFADGSVLTNNARLALDANQGGNLNAAISAVKDVNVIETSANPGSLIPSTVGGTLRGFASVAPGDTTGAVFGLTQPGATTILTGSTKVDKVYASPGSIIDARNLFGGEDIVYFTGAWGDYTKNLTTVSGAIVFERTVDGLTERVTVLNGATTAGRDKLVFVDGSVITNNARTVLDANQGGNLAAAITVVTGYDANTTTPLPGPSVTITTNDSALKMGETATITFTLSQAATDFIVGDVSVTGGSLSNFSGSGTIYTATLTPDGSYTGLAKVSVAKDKFTNSAGQNNSAGSLELSVDTAVPVAPIFNPVATDNIINVAEVGSTTITGTNEASATVALSIGGNTRAATVSGTTWSYTLTPEDITAMGQGAKTLSATQTDAAGNISAAGTHVITVDTTLPTTTITSAIYNDSTGVLAITGTNFNTLGVADGSDVKGQLDWTKLTWDTNGDGTIVNNKTFSLSEINSALVTNATTLTVSLTSAAKTALEAMSGFGASGGNDTLDVTAGFIKDAAGNAATTDARENGPLVTDNTPPTSTLTSASYDGSTGVLTVTGTNLNELGVAIGTDVKGFLNWANLSWDINGDSATADKTFALADITSAVVTNSTTLTITLTSAAKANLEGADGFAAADGVDTLDVIAGFIKDSAGNAATTDAKANALLTFSDKTAPTVTAFGSSTDNGIYKASSSINVMATMSETVLAGSKLTVTLNTGATVELTATAAGMTLSGTYTVGSSHNTADLTVSSFTSAVQDIYGNALVSTALPSSNLGGGKDLVIDTTLPTTQLTSAAYNNTSGVLTLTGTGLDTLGVSNGTDVKAQLDWSKLVWDINGDNTTTPDISFSVNDFTSAMVTNSTTLTLTLTSAKKALLEVNNGFAAAGGADKLDIAAGFIKDTAGNAATTDAKADAPITFIDTTAPTVTKFTSNTVDGFYKASSQINVMATMSETVLAGSNLTVTLDTGGIVELTAAVTGTTLSGTYTVGNGHNTSDLTVSSYTAGTVTDLNGNTLQATSLPANQNLAHNAALVVDTTSPNATISSASYNGSNGVLSLIGTNFDSLGVTTTTDIKAHLDWAKLVWDINGDNNTTADKIFASGDIASALVGSASTLIVTLTASGKAALEGFAGFGAAGAADKLDVTAGFIKDIAGNAATTDAAINASLTYTDTTAPAAASSAPVAAAGPHINVSESTAGFSVLVALSGTQAAVGDVVELKLGGNSLATPLLRQLTASDISAGNHTFTLAANSLGVDGNKVLTSVVTDAAGNVGVVSPSLTLTLDTLAPTKGSAPTTIAGSTIDASEAVNGFDVVFSLASTGAKLGDSVELKLGGATFATPITKVLTSQETAANSVTFRVKGSDLGGDGSKLLTAVVTDVAGNSGPPSDPLSLTLATSASRSISYSDSMFVEAAANDGSIHTRITLVLSGDTFAGTDGQVLNGVSFQNVPAGLSLKVIKTTSTTATLELTGKAGSHADNNDISNLSVSLANEAFSTGNASTVTGANRSDLTINFADDGLILNGNAQLNVMNGGSGKEVIYGQGGADVINGGGGADIIDISDIGSTEESSATVRVTSTSHGLDTVIGFKGGSIGLGGDILDFSGIASLADSVATGLSSTANFANNNVFVFNSTPILIAAAAAAIANDADVTATQGYIVISDSANSNRVTVYHSTDLAGDGTETALVVLTGVSIGTLTSANFLV